MLTNYMRWIFEDGKYEGDISTWIDHDRLHHALVPSAHGEPIKRPDDSDHVPRPELTAKAFWEAIKRGQDEAFRAGPDSLQNILTPAQQRAESADGP
jgi:hypothetical protein